MLSSTPIVLFYDNISNSMFLMPIFYITILFVFRCFKVGLIN